MPRKDERGFQISKSIDSESDEEFRREGARRWPDCFTDLLMSIESRACFRAFDFYFSGCIMGGLALCAISIMGKWVYFLAWHIFSNDGIRSLDVIRFGCDIAKGALYFLIVLVWYTVCYKNTKVEAFWEECHLIKSMMAGGFIARPAAVSMGVLMFVSSNIAMPKLKMAAAIETIGYDGSALANFDSCMANSREVGTYGSIVGSGPVASVWGQRFYRQSPVGCYSVRPHSIFGIQLPQEFGFTADTFYNIATAPGQQISDVQGLEHPFVDGQIDTSLHCTYVCSIYKGVAFKNLVSSLGAIFAGAAIVVTLADRLSSRVGWFLVEQGTSPSELCHALTGQHLPAEDLHEDQLEELAEDIQPVYKHFPGSPTLAMLQFLAVLLAAGYVAPRGALDGFETVDFHITLMIIVAVGIALLLRAWNPFTCRTVIYTKTLWLEGMDFFPVPAPDGQGFVQQRFTLYDWLHTSTKERSILLLRYCRCIQMSEVVRLYDRKGFTGLRSAGEQGTTALGSSVTDARKEKLTGVMDLFCCVLVVVSNFLRKLATPWVFCAKTIPSKVDDEKQQLFIVTRNKIITSVDHQVYATNSHVETVRHRTMVCIHPLSKGMIVKLGEGETVFVKFFDCPSLGHYCDSEGKETLQTIGPEEKYTYQVPIKDLYEHDIEWSFLRHLLGEASMQEALAGA